MGAGAVHQCHALRRDLLLLPSLANQRTGGNRNQTKVSVTKRVSALCLRPKRSEHKTKVSETKASEVGKNVSEISKRDFGGESAFSCLATQRTGGEHKLAILNSIYAISR